MRQKEQKLDRIIDVHCHILPGLDDGSRDMEETLAMLAIAQESGITDIVATPHYKAGRRCAGPDSIRRRVREVQEAAEEQGIDIALYPGNEILYFSELEEALEEEKLCTLCGSSYLLLEFSPAEIFRTVYNAVDWLLGLGYLPIIAHAERYDCVRKDLKNVETLRNMGAQIQVNAASVTGGEGLQAMWFVQKLLGRELVDYVATDAHRCGERTPELRKCCQKLLQKYRKEYVDKIFCGNALKWIPPQDARGNGYAG